MSALSAAEACARFAAHDGDVLSAADFHDGEAPLAALLDDLPDAARARLNALRRFETDEPLVPVPLAARIVVTQPVLVRDHLAAYLAGVRDGAGSNDPLVVHRGGAYAIINGHHRFTASRLRGDPFRRARCYDLDRDGGGS